MNNIEQKRQTYNKWFKIGLIALVALVVSPIIFLVVKGLVGLLVAAVIGLIATNFAPMVSMKLANWKVKSIVSESRENPIETMFNLLVEKKEAFKRFKTRVEDAVVGHKNFEQKSLEFAKLYPSRAQEFVIQVAAMARVVKQQKDALSQAQVAIRNGDLKLDEMRAYWDMSQIAQAANKAAGMDTGDQFEKLKLDTACDSVTDSVNRAFAEMEVAAQLSNPELENNPSSTLDSNIIEVKAKVLVQ